MKPLVGTPQLSAWKGRFGDAYVDRQGRAARWKIEAGIETFRRILGARDIASVLEVGSNIGLNLRFLQVLFKGQCKLYAVEPNRKAFDRLISEPAVRLERAWNCDVFRLPLPDASIDLVFTSGVLIHIAPDDLGCAMGEIVRVAKRYVLCIEYFSHTPVEVPYRGRRQLLFKRDFGACYLERFPALRWVDYGFLWQQEFRIFDNLTWWLFEKTSTKP